MFDGKLAAYLLNPSASDYQAGQLAAEYAAAPAFACAAAPDAGALSALLDVLSTKLDEQGGHDLLATMELPLARVLADMERIGFAVDAEGIRQFGDSLRAELNGILQNIYAEVGYEFNLNSPKQLGEALFDKLGLPPRKKTARGYSTDAETLESLQAAGAELCYFSPLRDAALPQHIGGLYLPGGYPELYAAQLAANTAMRCAINTAVQRGLPTVAECGGFLYLGQTLEDDAGTAHPMAGVLPGQGFRVGRLVRFGYAALTPQADSMLFRAGEPVPVHEFHHWDSTCNGTAFAAQKANGRHWDCGFANGHLYAGFPHLYWAGTPLPQRFVTAAAQYAQTKTGRTV